MLFQFYILFNLVAALELDVSSKKSICEAIALVQDGLLNYYEGTRYGGTVGMFQPPYYWWQAGEAFGGLLDAMYYCQNETYHDLLYNAFIAQTGTGYDYIPSNQSLTEGNDDQGVWGITIMAAAEMNFTAPKAPVPDWLALSQAIFNTMWSRWDTEHCAGGLRWQIFQWNSGYNYKNTISNACLFHMAARLARYTGNETYVKVAETVYDWLNQVGYIVSSNSIIDTYDGASITTGCKDVNPLQWSYNNGIMLGGAAYLWNTTQDPKWKTAVEGLTNAATGFFQQNVMYERACQDHGTCRNDQRSFKSIFSRMLSRTSIIAPFTADTLKPLLLSSAKAAATSCSGGTDGVTCGLNWNKGKWDGVYGLGEQMCALEILNSLLIDQVPGPFTQKDQGLAQGDPNAGMNANMPNLLRPNQKITPGEQTAAGTLTAVVLAWLMGGATWMVV